ncbi:MAG TPA: dienelactone hydrolase [Cyanobacteria bacterium UBA12227]|nr:dienelactone hydrolase [Cyanobacteria bacterium UBA12227]HAX86542.1 dienelactone hydrolase [Cyanobacteria bacterium UBA11370]HBY80389.1 dienelactone hydrolase [Cyanobacteria bacterium UBA11148]
MKFQLNGSVDRVFRDSQNPKQVNSRCKIKTIGNYALSTIIVLLSWGSAAPTSAAERLTLRIGPFEQSVEINDLETFAETGKLSPALKPYSSLLTPQVQQLLTKRLQIDPNLTEKFINDLLSSADGARLLDQIGLALPNSSLEQLQAALFLAARQANGLSVLSFLRAYPEESVVVDASSAIAIALQINTSYLQSLAIEPILEQELAATDEATFRPSFDPTAMGSQYVQERTLRLRDRERHRTIFVDLYWADNPSGPLVILSHGFGSDRKFLTYLARHLASHGITVASLEHPGSNFESLNGVSLGTNPQEVLPPSEFLDRPKDVSFVLDRLTEMDRGYGTLSDKLNTEQVTVIGHSLGGYTALALAGGKLDLETLREFCKKRDPLGRSPADWFQCAATELTDEDVQLEDRRVVQVIALNAVTGHLFGTKGLTQVRIPTLILTGTEDAITPSLEHQLRPFAQLGGSKYLMAAIGGTHLSVTDQANLNDALAQSTLVKELTGEDAEPLRQLLRGVSLAFVKQLTPEAELYQPFLSPAYAQSLSTPTLALRLNTTLPPTLATWLQVLSVPNQQIALRLPKFNQWSIGTIRWPFSSSVKPTQTDFGNA